ncbi:MAG: hypothetical protein OXG39_19175 [Chloroflexi bacterium]|nr:hypothetical protein [Chloroflexota bacterium]
MPATHTLDTKIEALNLLNLHDGDLKLVNSRLGIPIRTMRGWLLDEQQLRLQYYDRQYHHFANIKFKLLNKFLVFSLDTMEKLMTGDLGDHTLSQLTYVLSTLLNQAARLEKSFEDLPPDLESDAEQPNRIRYVYEDEPGADPPPADANPPQPDPTQSSGLRPAPENIPGMGLDQDPEGGALATEALLQDSLELLDGTDLPDALLELLRSEQEGQEPEKRPNRRKRSLGQTHRKRRKRRKRRR